jgi:hypothetical protein
MCNILIYFCNIQMKHLQHTYETSETLEYICLQHTLSAQRNISFLLGRMEGRRHVEFTGGSSPTALVGGGSPAPAARRGKEAAPIQLGEGATRVHSCRACHAGPPVTGAIGAVVSQCRGPLGPPCHDLLMLRPR